MCGRSTAFLRMDMALFKASSQLNIEWNLYNEYVYSFHLIYTYHLCFCVCFCLYDSLLSRKVGFIINFSSKDHRHAILFLHKTIDFLCTFQTHLDIKDFRNNPVRLFHRIKLGYIKKYKHIRLQHHNSFITIYECKPGREKLTTQL